MVMATCASIAPPVDGVPLLSLVVVMRAFSLLHRFAEKLAREGLLMFRGPHARNGSQPVFTRASAPADDVFEAAGSGV